MFGFVGRVVLVVLWLLLLVHLSVGQQDDWKISFISTKCFNNPNDNSDLIVTGSGFVVGEEVACRFEVNKLVYLIPGKVATTSEVVCPQPFFHFTLCSGQYGQRMVEFGNMFLSVKKAPGEGYTQVSNVVPINILNPLCPYGGDTTKYAFVQNNYILYDIREESNVKNQKVNVYFPPLEDALLACDAGSPTPWRCSKEAVVSAAPGTRITYSMAFPAIFDINCKNTNTKDCVWAALSYVEAWDPKDQVFCSYYDPVQNDGKGGCHVHFEREEEKKVYEGEDCLGFVMSS